MSVLRDWGLVTYRTGPLRVARAGSGFASLRSGKLHGAYVYDLVHNVKSQYGWKNFNPTLQHPDQNSVTIQMNGVTLMGEDHGSSFKDTSMQNTLMFAPGVTGSIPRCNAPYVGQVGECLPVSDERFGPSVTGQMSNARGELICAVSRDTLFFSSAEAVNAYPSVLHLNSVYRLLIQVRTDLVILVDHVSASNNSPVNRFNMIFSNAERPYRWRKYLKKLSGAFVTGPDRREYSVVVSSGDGAALPATTVLRKYQRKDEEAPNMAKPGTLYGLNVSVPLSKGLATAVYVLHGPSISLRSLKSRVVKLKQLELNVETATDHFDIKVSLDYKSSTFKPLEMYSRKDKSQVVVSDSDCFVHASKPSGKSNAAKPGPIPAKSGHNPAVKPNTLKVEQSKNVKVPNGKSPKNQKFFPPPLVNSKSQKFKAIAANRSSSDDYVMHVITTPAGSSAPLPHTERTAPAEIYYVIYLPLSTTCFVASFLLFYSCCRRKKVRSKCVASFFRLVYIGIIFRFRVKK